MRYLYLIVWPLSLILIALLAGELMSAIVHYHPPSATIAVSPAEPPPLPRFLQQFIEPPAGK